MVGVRIALCVSFAGSAAVVLAYAAARGLLSLLSSCLPSIALHGMQGKVSYVEFACASLRIRQRVRN